MVVVSCVEEKEPYRCHPHKLVGKDGMCKKGVCSMDINTPEMTATFQVRYMKRWCDYVQYNSATTYKITNPRL